MDPFTPTKILTHSIFEDIILWIQYGIDSISQKVSNTVDPTSPTLTTSFNIFHTSLFKFILIIIVLILCAGIIYVLIRMRELKHADAKKYKEYFIRPSPTAQTNKRWQNVEALFQSSNPNDWRVAIIEADTMLDDLITSLGYKGENLGERLKSIPPATFPALQLAWEAHKIRNRIAHQGIDYPLQPGEAWHVFKLFQAVFRDTHYI
ncbi:hypothetical protein A2997_02480 [Candidatus Nomurabacteria bacterium RIFCSPLOWO2_01_FULL_36_10b]|uniref:Uncharacterized protein n=1 Tax=Candidatus Nomurabacteria bacterium RIFCSPLOWO2_01_FULL_36_10b TaxID=1801766 RepID=A0A1F6WNC6_9BACT|nr:MAG: hypothetical protein A2997_02480 [Candidatus Nomurabacteria bacterium RIFCSPLOWO2_01_FULL_36_10b]